MIRIHTLIFTFLLALGATRLAAQSVPNPALADFSLSNTSNTASTVMHRFGYAFEKGQVPAGSSVIAYRADGAAVPTAQCETNHWSDGSLRKATILLQDSSTLAAGASRQYLLGTVSQAQRVSSFDPWAWIAAHGNDFTVNITNHTGSLSGARSNLLFSLKTAIATATRREILADTDRFVRVVVWQKVAGEEQLLCFFHVDFWLDAAGSTPVAIEWTPVLRLPFAVTNPFGVEQPREKHTYDAAVAYGSTTLDSRTGLAQAQHCSW